MQLPAGTPATPDDPLVAATRNELAAVGREETVAGQLALTLAAALGSPMNTGSSKAALSRELRATILVALDGATRKADPVDGFAARRARRAAGQ